MPKSQSPLEQLLALAEVAVPAAKLLSSAAQAEAAKHDLKPEEALKFVKSFGLDLLEDVLAPVAKTAPAAKPEASRAAAEPEPSKASPEEEIPSAASVAARAAAASDSSYQQARTKALQSFKAWTEEVAEGKTTKDFTHTMAHEHAYRLVGELKKQGWQAESRNYAEAKHSWLQVQCPKVR